MSINLGTGPKPASDSTSVVFASDAPTLAAPTTSATPSVSRVTSSATNVTLKSLNANRKGLFVYNDATTNLFVKLGAVASLTSFTVKILPGNYYELPSSTIYTGVVDGIWDGTPSGAASVTEVI